MQGIEKKKKTIKQLLCFVWRHACTRHELCGYFWHVTNGVENGWELPKILWCVESSPIKTLPDLEERKRKEERESNSRCIHSRIKEAHHLSPVIRRLCHPCLQLPLEMSTRQGGARDVTPRPHPHSPIPFPIPTKFPMGNEAGIFHGNSSSIKFFRREKFPVYFLKSFFSFFF